LRSTQKDFAPVALVATVPIVLMVNPKVPANTVQELIALAKREQEAQLRLVRIGRRRIIWRPPFSRQWQTSSCSTFRIGAPHLR
jgi:hypothetical protein